MNYRQEVDGLRGLAVLSVIFFHAGFEIFSGGFVGVDIFFVISGYLITSIILTERQNGTFSLVSFYERRLRRILPALFCVMLASTVVAWIFLLPEEMKSFSQSIVATSLYLSNVFFWKTSGYFDASADIKPLLHTWSLSIEEQYYLIFPVFLIFIWKFRIYWALLILAILTILSISAIEILPNSTAFYLLPTRCWELLLGAFVAIYFIIRSENTTNHHHLKEVAGCIGMGMLIFSVFAFDKHTPFPGLYTLVPTVGTALVILCSSKETITGKLLSNSILVWIGLVSYSAYLWHQPLFAFARIERAEDLDYSSYMTMIVIIFLLAYLSWKYVETPFRNKETFNRRQIFVYSASISVAFIAFGLIGTISNGYSKVRFSHDELETLASFERSPLRLCSYDDCGLDKANKEDWILIGDSNAYHFSDLLNQVINQKGKTLYNLAKGGCLPAIGFERKDQLQEFNRDCNEHYLKVRNYALNESSPKNILISAAWGYYVYGDSYPQTDGFKKFFDTQAYPIGINIANEKARAEYVIKAIKDEVSAYSKTGKNVFLIYPMPFLKSEIPQNHTRINWEDLYPYELFVKRNEQLLEAFKELESLPNVKVFKPDTIICSGEPNRVCVSRVEGQSLYNDRSHLSNFGAKEVFTDFFNDIVK